jgi:hydrogenase maturation factor
MRVLSQAEFGIAVCVADDDTRQEVATDLVEPVNQGDELLVHAGVAIANLGAAA